EGDTGVGLIGVGGLGGRSRRSGAGRRAVRAAAAGQQPGGRGRHGAHTGALEERTAGNELSLHGVSSLIFFRGASAKPKAPRAGPDLSQASWGRGLGPARFWFLL